MPIHFDAIILGAGAAGLLCAARAGQRGKRVLLLDHADSAGKKILISGGGRCNFTNINASPKNYYSENPHFCISALKGYTAQDFLSLVQKHKIPYHEKTLGQLFCDNSAHDILSMLLKECHESGATLQIKETVTSVSRADYFTVATNKGAYTTPSLVLATGGLSIPKMGASDFGHRLAQQFNLPIIAPTPALVPLTFAHPLLDMMQSLSGISLDVVAHCGKACFREAMVFTHRGLSGPAILQISSLWQAGYSIELDLCPDLSEPEIASRLLARKGTRPKAELKTILAELLPQRLAQSLATAFWNNPVMASMPERTLRGIATFLKGWTLTPNGTEGFAKAEVTLGGIDTKALSSKTMMSNSVSGLYAIGEVVDVTGWLGGYNFQWAWSSGWAAGSAI